MIRDLVCSTFDDADVYWEEACNDPAGSHCTARFCHVPRTFEGCLRREWQLSVIAVCRSKEDESFVSRSEVIDVEVRLQKLEV